MLRKTTTILAIAFTATATACGGAAESTNPTKQELAEEQSNTSTGSDKSEPTPGAPSSEPKPEPKPGATPDAPKPAACDLAALNEELSNMMLETALEQHKHFRCLCDDQGYPLVGNINSKGTRASKFCPTLKEKGLL